ncbi:MAG: hypothetical protein CMJ30_05650 [Phycisphaerae bacterium]|jgi:hypothetical protein|nr:hypothetical protein [Phycisphaerae bacterium]
MKQGENPWFRVLGGVAIVNVLLILGVLVWLRAEGRLDANRVQQIAAVLQPEPAMVETEPEPQRLVAESGGQLVFASSHLVIGKLFDQVKEQERLIAEKDLELASQQDDISSLEGVVAAQRKLLDEDPEVDLFAMGEAMAADYAGLPSEAAQQLLMLYIESPEKAAGLYSTLGGVDLQDVIRALHKEDRAQVVQDLQRLKHEHASRARKPATISSAKSAESVSPR